MTILKMLGQSGILTVLGMGIVFSFLVIMVIAVTLMGKILGSGITNNDAGPSAVPGTQDKNIIVAISAAVDNFRRKN